MVDKVCVGKIVAAHGVRGLVKLRSFTENPRDLVAYGGLSDELGAPVKIELLSGGRDAFIARIDGTSDRTRAETYKGKALYVDRAALPAAGEQEYYNADLIGLAVFTQDGKSLGTLIALHNFGAGDIMEVGSSGTDTIMLPFNRAFVPNIDFACRRLTLADYVEVT